MGISRGVTVTYGAFSTGSGVEMHGPYQAHFDFGSMSISFVLIVTKSTEAALKSACDDIEAQLRKRDQNLRIQAPGGDWANYTHGSNALNTSCEVAKQGDRQTDTGWSRSYTATFSALLPASDNDGFFSIDTSVTYLPSRQAIVRVSGEVRGESGSSAKTKYESNIATKETSILNLVDSGVTWELTGEDQAWDRTNHVFRFTREWTELLYEQPQGFSDSKVVAHNVVFTRISAYPGDSEADTNRPETFLLQYTSSLDKNEISGDQEISDFYEDTIYPWIRDLFDTVWSPKAFAVVQHRRNIDPTTNTIRAEITIQAYMSGTDLIESSRIEEYQDQRSPDFTPVWDEDELSAYVDQQFMIRLRSTTTTETRFGTHEAISPLTPNNVKASGWNVLQARKSASPMYVGEEEPRVRLTMLTEHRLERFTKRPGDGGYTVVAPRYGNRDNNPYYNPGADPRTEAERTRAVEEQTG